MLLYVVSHAFSDHSLELYVLALLLKSGVLFTWIML